MSHDLRQSGQFCFQAAGALLKAVTHDLEELTSKTMKGTPASILYAFPVRHQPIFFSLNGPAFHLDRHSEESRCDSWRPSRTQWPPTVAVTVCSLSKEQESRVWNAWKLSSFFGFWNKSLNFSSWAEFISSSKIVGQGIHVYSDV